MTLKEEIQLLNKTKKYHTSLDDINYWFKRINRTIYHGELTPFPKIEIRRMHGVWAYVLYEEELRLTPLHLHMNKYFNNMNHFVHVLAHEMVHKWQMDINGDTGNHNKHFFSWRIPYEEHGLTLHRAA